MRLASIEDSLRDEPPNASWSEVSRQRGGGRSLGRRPLLLVGLVGMGASLVAVGLAFFSAGTQAMSSTAGIVTLAALVVLVVSFAF